MKKYLPYSKSFIQKYGIYHSSRVFTILEWLNHSWSRMHKLYVWFKLHTMFERIIKLYANLMLKGLNKSFLLNLSNITKAYRIWVMKVLIFKVDRKTTSIHVHLQHYQYINLEQWLVHHLLECIFNHVLHHIILHHIWLPYLNNIL